MNKVVKSILIIIVTLFVLVIGAYVIFHFLDKSKEANSPIEQDSYCKNFKWKRVSSGYDSKTIIELASKLETTAKLDAQKLDSSSIKFTTSLEKIINSNSNMEFSVSDELYDNLIAYCFEIDVITRMLKENTFGSDSVLLTKARSKLLEISLSFGTIKQNEQKKTNDFSNDNNIDKPTMKHKILCNYSAALDF